MSTQRYLIVPGTWALSRPTVDYWEPEGAFVRFLAEQGFENLWLGQPFWDTELAGSTVERVVSQRWAQGLWHAGWRVGGDFLAYFLSQQRSPETIALIAHSHGWQVVLYALSRPWCPAVGAVCAVAGPLRADMMEVYRVARPKMGRLMYVTTGRRDRWKWLGTIGTGSWLDTLGSAAGITSGPPDADRVERMPDLDHTELLADPARYHRWLASGRLAYLRVSRPAA